MWQFHIQRDKKGYKNICLNKALHIFRDMTHNLTCSSRPCLVQPSKTVSSRCCKERSSVTSKLDKRGMQLIWTAVKDKKKTNHTAGGHSSIAACCFSPYVGILLYGKGQTLSLWWLWTVYPSGSGSPSPVLEVWSRDQTSWTPDCPTQLYVGPGSSSAWPHTSSSLRQSWGAASTTEERQSLKHLGCGSNLMFGVCKDINNY